MCFSSANLFREMQGAQQMSGYFIVIWNPGHFHKNPGERDAMTKSGTIPVKPGWLEYMNF